LIDLSDWVRCSDHQILDVINLLEYDNDLSALHQRLKRLQKDYFAPNERVVILHLDNEYFYHGCKTGFTTHNLFVIIRSLGFPLHVFTFITSYPNYRTAIEPFVVSEFDVPEVFNPLMHFISLEVLYQQQVFNTTINKQIRFHAMSLLGTARSHRVKLYQFIHYHGLGDRINYTFTNPTAGLLSDTNIKTAMGDCAPPVYDMIYSHPHRINDGWANFVDNYPDILQLNSIVPQVTVNSNLTGAGVDFYNSHAIDIVTESALDYADVYVSEKTFRPILMQTPFIIFGSQGTLRHLRSFGLETFGDFWDESYDSVADPRDRFLAVGDLLKQLCDRPLDQMRTMYDAMRPRLQHNRDIMLEYITNIIEPLRRKLEYKPT